MSESSNPLGDDSFRRTAFFSRSPRLDLIRIVRIGLRMQKTGLGSRDRAAARPPLRRRLAGFKLLINDREKWRSFVRDGSGTPVSSAVVSAVCAKKRSGQKAQEEETFRSYRWTDVTLQYYNINVPHV